MSTAEDLMVHPPAMAEMVGGVLETETVRDDQAAVIAAEMAAEGHATPQATHVAVEVPVELARLEAETEE